MQEDEEETREDVPGDAAEAASEVLVSQRFGSKKGLGSAKEPLAPGKKSLSKIARGAIFREVVLAKVRELKETEAQKKFEEEKLKSSK
jgi:calcium/calmodulin-dependent protein kinase I